jgi:hypothetical protein
MKNNPLEKVIEGKVCKLAKSFGILQYKFTSPQRRSVPDRVFLYGGKVWFVEFKRAGETPTAAQLIEHEKFQKVGIEVFVVDSVETGKALMKRMVNS